MREWGTVMPEVFSPPGVTTPAYSVEEPPTPPPTDAFPRLFPVPPNLGRRTTPDRSRRRRNSRQSANARTYTSPFHPQSPCPDRTQLPSLTQRCKTLPSSASSTAPSTPSRRPLSPTPSPRARSPVSFWRHISRDAGDQDGEDRHHRSPAHSFHTNAPPSPFHRHHHHRPHHSLPHSPISPSTPLSPPPPRHYQHHQQHVLLSAHHRTRRHLRALERELQRLENTPDGFFDHRHRQDEDHGHGHVRGGGGARWGAWGLDGIGRREEWSNSGGFWGGGHGFSEEEW